MYRCRERERLLKAAGGKKECLVGFDCKLNNVVLSLKLAAARGAFINWEWVKCRVTEGFICEICPMTLFLFFFVATIE